MNDLFECSSEDTGATVQVLAVKNPQGLKTYLNPDKHTYFFDLFTVSPNVASKYNQLAEANEDDCCMYIKLKLKGFNAK